MEPKKIALLVGALVIAAITAVMAKNMFGQSAAPTAQATVSVATGPEVLVATRALPVGTIIGVDSFRYQPWPKELIQNAYYLKGTAEPQALAGTVVRNAVSAGQPVTQGSLVKPGDRGFIAAALGPGMRAVSIVVSAASGVAGFAFPGDRVDLVLSQTISGADTGTTLKTSETIVRNLRVLATDQRTTSEDEKGNRTVVVFNTVTLEVTPRIAEKIAVSQKIGDLSLSLRSIADNTAELDRAIAAGEVSVPTGINPKDNKNALVAIASRPTDTDTTYVTGADVSRFQRRTVPSQSASTAAPAASVTVNSFGGPAPKGPVVRVARGNNVTEVSVGGK